MVKVIGITGSIAVGKSTVTSYLITHGYTVLDADEISRHALDIGKPCYEAVKASFGCLNVDLTIDRKALGEIVFHDTYKKQQLENIIHPYVVEELKKGIEVCQDDLIFLDIPLLFEVHLESLCDKIGVVYVDEKTQEQRLMKRNNISSIEARHLMSQQISIEDKKDKGDFMIDNRLMLEDLYIEIERILKELKDEIISE
ncbi:MAG: dephospho-CoA kinase [Coprobacillus sp.]